VTAPHDAPTAAQLVEAVREFLEQDVMLAVDGQLRFHARVAARVLAIVERELALGPELAGEHAARLRELGVGDEAELAAAVRSGAMDGRLGELVAAIRETVRAKLAVADPGYADRA
jgi:Domain of unknown function (DUF6285)